MRACGLRFEEALDDAERPRHSRADVTLPRLPLQGDHADDPVRRGVERSRESGRGGHPGGVDGAGGPLRASTRATRSWRRTTSRRSGSGPWWRARSMASLAGLDAPASRRAASRWRGGLASHSGARSAGPLLDPMGAIGNAAGLPAVAVPTRLPASAGSRRASSSWGGPSTENAILAAARAYQACTDWHRRHPAPVLQVSPFSTAIRRYRTRAHTATIPPCPAPSSRGGAQGA